MSHRPSRLRATALGALPPEPLRLVRALLQLGRDAAVSLDYLTLRARSILTGRREPSVGLAVCAVFRDEAPYLAEWIAFHRLVGVERFYLYDNRSTDDWRSALAPELADGTVVVHPWPREPRRAQLAAYEHCLHRHRTDTRWIAFIDVDEFLFSPSGEQLPAILERFHARPGVLAAWRVFGTGGLREPPAGLVTESYLLRARSDHPEAWGTKPIVDPRRTYRRLGDPEVTGSPHVMQHFGSPRFWRLQPTTCEDGRTAPALPVEGDPLPGDVLRINHYRSKSAREAEEKARRDRVTTLETQSSDFLLRPDFNEIEDRTILPFVAELRRALTVRAALSD